DRVLVLDDLSTGRFENIEHLPEVACVIDSTLNRETVRDLVREVDVVYHLAATVGVQLVVDEPIKTIINNIWGTETVLEEACRYRRRILITSSSEVYGKGSRRVFQENDDRVMGATSLTRWGYAESKAIDEFLGLAYWYEKRHPVVIVRLFNTVGPRQTGRYGMVIPRFVEQALRNEPVTIHGDGQQTRCFAYVGDVVPALITLMDRSDLCGEVFNVGNSHRVTIEALAQRVIRRTRSRSKIIYIPYDQAYGQGYEDMRHRAPSLAKVKKAIGYHPATSLDMILDAVIEDVKRRLRIGS
ncbi:MAG: GDP-mannose 4,6-dehydratase, partial [Candidatus Hydrogenedentes bacterium]|nr:GDP-mannose 4,6-dehydratase [Candidatus Hydrogenedentota bacterium]